MARVSTWRSRRVVPRQVNLNQLATSRAKNEVNTELQKTAVPLVATWDFKSDVYCDVIQSFLKSRFEASRVSVQSWFQKPAEFYREQSVLNEKEFNSF